MKKTAVEWLVDEILSGKLLMPSLIEQAKEIEKENMVVFLQSVFGMEGFDYEKSYDDFISRRKNIGGNWSGIWINIRSH